MSTAPVVYVVDDDPTVASMISRLMSTLQLHTKEYSCAEQFLAECDVRDHGCAVVDVQLPGMSGIELQSTLAACDTQMPLIAISGFGDIPMCVKAMKAGAFHFLMKPFCTRELSSVIGRAIAFDAIRCEQYERKCEFDRRLALLTEEERQTLDLIVLGKPNKEIASALDISLRTVQFRIAGINQKMQVSTRAALNNLVITSMAKPTEVCDELIDPRGRRLVRFDPAESIDSQLSYRIANLVPGT